MRNCPTCGTAVDGMVCPVCSPQSRADPLRWTCSVVIRGERCAGIAAYSPSTNGGGPWFCTHHIPGFRPGDPCRGPVPDHFRSAVRAIGPKPLDAEATIERDALQAGL